MVPSCSRTWPGLRQLGRVVDEHGGFLSPGSLSQWGTGTTYPTPSWLGSLVSGQFHLSTRAPVRKLRQWGPKHPASCYVRLTQGSDFGVKSAQRGSWLRSLRRVPLPLCSSSGLASGPRDGGCVLTTRAGDKSLPKAGLGFSGGSHISSENSVKAAAVF
jgi:hypothetical protein